MLRFYFELGKEISLNSFKAVYGSGIYNALYKNNKLILSNDALCAITILTAESNPNEKDIIINVIMRIISK